MIIMGVDPGIATIGCGVIRFEGNKFTPLFYDAIITKPSMMFSDRLCKIKNELNELINIYKPDAFAVEELFFNTNVKTAISVGHGRGVIVLAGAEAGVPVFEYTPLQVKQAVTGYGRADKNQVQQMVKIILKLEKIPKPDDVADALAVAICHANSANFSEQFRL